MQFRINKESNPKTIAETVVSQRKTKHVGSKKIRVTLDDAGVVKIKNEEGWVLLSVTYKTARALAGALNSLANQAEWKE